MDNAKNNKERSLHLNLTMGYSLKLFNSTFIIIMEFCQQTKYPQQLFYYHVRTTRIRIFDYNAKKLFINDN